MFIFSKVDANDFQIEQFQITGSTYEPKGDVIFNGVKFNCSNRSGLVELAECAALCNDSALDYNEVSFSSMMSYIISSLFFFSLK
jgi:Ca2+ transporting ATPase